MKQYYCGVPIKCLRAYKMTSKHLEEGGELNWQMAPQGDDFSD